MRVVGLHSTFTRLFHDWLISRGRIEVSNMHRSAIFVLGCVPTILLAVAAMKLSDTRPVERRLAPSVVGQFVNQHCVDCHNGGVKRGGLDLTDSKTADVATHPEVWEKVARKLMARQMPPAGKPRPDERTYETVVTSLEAELDR